MKLQELLRLNESVHTIQGNVRSLNRLRGKNKEYLAGTVNVAGYVHLANEKLARFPVKFGTVDGAEFYWSNNQLTSLEGGPSAVGGNFDCSWNQLTSLEGAPGTVGGYFACHDNLLTSLVGVHRILRRIDGRLDIWKNPIEHGGIGLLLVEGLTKINAGDHPAFKIINEHLGQGKPGLLRCQEALHDAGLGEFATL